MGILGLSKLLFEKAPNSIKENDPKNYFGRRIAVDASMSIYQFMIAMHGAQQDYGGYRSGAPAPSSVPTSAPVPSTESASSAAPSASITDAEPSKVLDATQDTDEDELDGRVRVASDDEDDNEDEKKPPATNDAEAKGEAPTGAAAATTTTGFNAATFHAQYSELSNKEGEVTSHLIGLFSRTLRLVDEGVKPIYVFDGAPPQLKRSNELENRKKNAEKNKSEMANAIDEGDYAKAHQLSKRTLRIGKKENEECKKLLRLMGIPVVQAPGEAEAQCVELVKKKKAWAVATEDMDALTFGAPVLLRHLSESSSSSGTNAKGEKRRVVELRTESILEELEFTYEMFVDMCILLGCDYIAKGCKITGIGPLKAFEGIRKYRSIESLIEHLQEENERYRNEQEQQRKRSNTDPQEAVPLADKYPISSEFNYKGARELFHHPDVLPGEWFDGGSLGGGPASNTVEREYGETNTKRHREDFEDNPEDPFHTFDLVVRDPDEEGLKKFLVEEKGFNIQRVEKGIARLRAALTKKTQGRLEDFFFSVKPVAAKTKSGADDASKGGPGGKRKRDEKGGGDAKRTLSGLNKGGGAKKAVKK